MLQAKTQYAIVLLSEVKGAITPIHIADVARDHKINLEFLKQVARLLRLAGLLKSIRGPGGGYILDAKQLPIPLSKIMYAVESKRDIKYAVKTKVDKIKMDLIHANLQQFMDKYIILDK